MDQNEFKHDQPVEGGKATVEEAARIQSTDLPGGGGGMDQTSEDRGREQPMASNDQSGDMQDTQQQDTTMPSNDDMPDSGMDEAA